MEEGAAEMVEAANPQVKHQIFTKDPGEMMHYLYKEVCVTTEDGKSHTGRVYTIDPVSQSVVLTKFNSDTQSLDGITVVMGHSVQEIVILDDNTDVFRGKLDALFKPAELSNLSPEELAAKKDKLKSWLLKNRIPIEVSETNGDNLSLAGALTIEPPYGPENCRSTNETILGRVQGMIKNMPDDYEG